MIPSEISREHILAAITEIQSEGVPKEREPTVWLLQYKGKYYPPKYVISIAGKHAFGQEYNHKLFSGGREANSFLEARGFEIEPISGKGNIGGEMHAFSWTIHDGDKATKVLDKSAFLHQGSGIPKEIRSFFLDREISGGQRIPITLLVDDAAYSAHLAMESQETARTRLFWNADFAVMLHQKYKSSYESYIGEKEPDVKVSMRLERLDGYKSYRVSFGYDVAEALAASDIEAEEIEEQGPRQEGGVTDYFGKKYERDPRNRRLAIQYHGLKCNACDFDFEEMYGDRGRGYIEVHHVRPISSLGGKQDVDPKKDLVTLCSNCHRMAHRRCDNVMGIEALKALVSKNTEKK